MVSRLCPRILGILWYSWNPSVFTKSHLLNLVSLVFFGILWYQEFALGFLESFGNKRMSWYLCYPFVSIKFTSLAAVIVGLGVKIVMMGSSILEIGESFLFLIIWVEIC